MMLTQQGATVSQVTAEALEGLRVTDLVYEDFWHTSPLTECIAAAVDQAVQPGASLLVIGPNAHLIATLRRLGNEVETWKFGNQVYETDVISPITHTVVPHQPLPRPERQYDAIVVCLTLERLTASPTESLRTLASGLKPGGSLILAAEQAGRLGRRIEGLRARRSQPWIRESISDAPSQVSWNWPSQPAYWLLNEGDWRETLAVAGLDTIGVSYTTGQRPVLRAVPLGMLSYVNAHAKHLIKRALPRWRDYVVIVTRAAQPAADRDEPVWVGGPLERLPLDRWPVVSVVVEDANLSRVEALLGAFARQTYPQDKLEVLLIGEQTDPDTACQSDFAVRWIVPTRIQSIIVGETRGDIIAHLSGRYIPSPLWAEGAVAAMAYGADVVVGAVRAGQKLIQHDSEHNAYGNVLYRRNILLSAHEAMADSPEFDTVAVATLRQKGARVVFCREALVDLGMPLDHTKLKGRSRAKSDAADPVVTGRIPRGWAGLLTSGQSLAFLLLVAGGVSSGITRQKRFGALMVPWLLGQAGRLPKAYSHFIAGHHNVSNGRR